MPCMATTMRCPDCKTQLMAKISWGRPPTKTEKVTVYELVLAAHKGAGCEGKEQLDNG